MGLQAEITLNSYDLCLVFASLIIIYLATHSPEYTLTASTPHSTVQTETWEEEKAVTLLEVLTFSILKCYILMRVLTSIMKIS